jgi:hypothetical protein
MRQINKAPATPPKTPNRKSVERQHLGSGEPDAAEQVLKSGIGA